MKLSTAVLAAGAAISLATAAVGAARLRQDAGTKPSGTSDRRAEPARLAGADAHQPRPRQALGS